MQINCPPNTQMVKVANGYICAKGTNALLTSAVFVRVYDGFLTPPPPNLNDVTIATSGKRATIIGTNWTVSDVPVPPLGMAGNTSPGKELTIIAWELKPYPGASGSPIQITGTAVNIFTGVIPSVPGAIDCCYGSGSASGGTPPSAEVYELNRQADLIVTVKNGPHTGNLTAKWIEPLHWILPTGKETLDIYAEPHGGYLELRGKEIVRSTHINFDPFAAILPGELLESDDALTVVLA